MKLKKILLTIFIFLLISSVSAVCTVDFSEDDYFPGETAVVLMQCDDNNEKRQDYTVSWYDQSAILLETDLGETPPVAGNLFSESFSISLPTTITSLQANLTGINLEGSDTVSIVGVPNGTLVLTNFTPGPTPRVGELSIIKFIVFDSNNLTITNAHCKFTISDSLTGAPIDSQSGDIISVDGKVTLEKIMTTNVFDEGITYVSDLQCYCIQDTEKRCFNSDLTFVSNQVGQATGSVRTLQWLTVNTITDKSTYSLDDKVIDVCANITNNNLESISMDISYLWRCDGNPEDTNRIVVDEHRETRVIVQNTTENFCAELNIVNKLSISNQDNTCVGATLVRVLDKENNNVFSYSTVSSDITFSSSNSALLTGTGDDLMAIAILLVGVMFFLFYMSTKLSFTDDMGKVVPLNAMIGMILVSAAGFIAYFSIQFALGIYLEMGFTDLIGSSIKGIHMFVSALAILLLFVLFFGIFINLGSSAIDWIDEKFSRGSQ